jgi:hypothetical protein
MKLLRLPRFAIFTAIRRASLRATTPLKAEQQLRQLREVYRDPPRLVFGK